jgi:hypothetical protein
MIESEEKEENDKIQVRLSQGKSLVVDNPQRHLD